MRIKFQKHRSCHSPSFQALSINSLEDGDSFWSPLTARKEIHSQPAMDRGQS